VDAGTPFQAPGWAEVRAIHRVAEVATLERLADLHILAADYAERRLRWKPREALWVVAVALHRLAQPFEIAWDPAYAGCTSFVELGGPVPEPAGGQPVLPGAVLDARLADLARRLG
jgi:hypothetical protein